MVKKIEAIFFDRDGTIGGDGHFVHPKDFKLYPFSQKAFDLLKDTGIKMFSFTNQHRISKGEATIKEFEEELLSYNFDKAYICPHAMNDEECNCQKPKPGMLLKVAEEYNLDLKRCVVIGDLGSDMIAADKVGAIKVLVKTGWGKGSIGEYRYLWQDVEPNFVAENLLEAIKWILIDD